MIVITQAEKDEALRKIARDLDIWREKNSHVCRRCGELGHEASRPLDSAGKNCRAAMRRKADEAKATP